MHIHEHQTKNILIKYGIPVPSFAVASNENEVLKAIDDLHLESAVLKVQIHAGGRGKAGGVKFAKTAMKFLPLARQLIGMENCQQPNRTNRRCCRKDFTRSSP